jgi:hypothetical protein
VTYQYGTYIKNIFHVKIHLLVTAESDKVTKIRVRMDPRWLARWIRIRIEVNPWIRMRIHNTAGYTP